MKTETLHMRISQELKDRLVVAAKEEKRTVSNFVMMVLEVWMEKEKKK